MLAPGLATMLVVLTTDAVADAPTCSTPRCARRRARRSTGSTPTAACRPTTPCCCSRRGASGVDADRRTSSPPPSHAVCADLAQQLVADAEGATQGHRDRGRRRRDARPTPSTVGRAVARSNLLKCAIHGEDPNWGRVLAAVGTTDAAFEPDAARRRDQRRLGLPRRRGRRGPRAGRPVRPRRRDHRRPRRRRRTRRRSGPTTSPPRTSTRTRRTRHEHVASNRHAAALAKAGRPRRGAALARALPRQDRRA